MTPANDISSISRRNFLIGLSLLPAGAALAACTGGSQPSPDPTAAAGTATATGTGTTAAAPGTEPTGSIRIGLARTQPSMDPGATAGGNTVTFFRPVYETLTQVESGGEVMPLLAESWEQTDDTTWRFHLREGVTFHNGDPFTAESVKFTVDRARDPNNQLAALARLGDIVEVTVVDDTTVDFVTETPNVVLPSNMSVIFIGSQAYFESAGAEAYANEPIGTGPWRMTEFTVDQTYAYDSYEDYWGERPAVKEILIQPVTETAPRISALLSGEIDIADSIPTDQISRVEDAEGMGVLTSLAGTVGMFSLNHELPGLSDKRVRQAINHAIDKQALLSSLFADHGELSGGQVIGSDCFGYNPDLDPYPFDPDLARSLLAEAGYSEGLQFEANVVANPAVGPDVALAIAAQLADVGITMDVRQVEFGVFRDQFYGATERPGAMSLLLSYDPQYDAHFVFNFFSEDALEKPLWDVTDEFASLWEQEIQESDRATREGMLQEMSAILHDEAPTIVLWQSDVIYGVRSDLDWQPGPGVIIDFRGRALHLRLTLSMFIDRAGGRIFYETYGSGPPMLLIHGGGSDAAHFQPMIRTLEQLFTVYAFDLPGFGQSKPAPGQELSHQVWIDTVHDLLAGLSIERAHVVGWSLGATVALGVAVQFPQLVDSLILLGAATPFRKPTRSSAIQERLDMISNGASAQQIADHLFAALQSALSPTTLSSRPEAIAMLKEELLRVDLDMYPLAADGMRRRADIADALPSIEAPTLLVCGEYDSICPIEGALDLNRRIPDSYVKMIADCGHYYGCERPDETARVIARFAGSQPIRS